MLTIEPPFYTVRGVPVFRDDGDPRQFWVLPAPPALVGDDGQPGFTLYKYRRDLTDNPALDPTRARGGGLAFFDVETAPPPLAALQAEVSSLAGRPDAVVSPVVFRSGTVRGIIAHTGGTGNDELVEDLVQTTVASPVSPHRATFALALSAEGATLMEQAARGGSLPVGVAYELKFLALTPVLHAVVTMSYSRMYDHFAASVGFTYYVQAKFDLDLTWLVEHDFIHIEITSFTDGADADRQRQTVMDLVAARVQGDFFRTGVPAQPTAGDALTQMLTHLVGGGDITSASAYFVLKARLDVVREAKDFVLRYDGRTAIELTHVSTGLLSTLVAGGTPPRIAELDLDDPFFSALTVEVVSGVDFAAMPDLTRAVAHLSHGDFRASYEFAPGGSDRGRFEVPLTDPRDDAYAVSYELFFADGGDPVVTTGPVPRRDRVLVLSPLELVDYTRVTLLLGPVDPEVVPQIDVLVRLVTSTGDVEVAREQVTLGAQTPEVVWRHHQPHGSGVRTLVLTQWVDARGVRHDGQRTELPAGTASFVALGPFVDVLTLSAVPAVDWTTGATHAQVEISYADGGYVVDKTLTFLAADAHGAQSLDIPLLDATHRAYRWRQVVFLPTGPVASTWADSDTSILVFGTPPRTTEDVRLVWVGDAGAAFGLRVDLRVTAAAGEQTVSAFLRTGADLEKVVTVPLDSGGRLIYRFEVRRVAADGETLVQSGEAQTTLLVVRAA